MSMVVETNKLILMHHARSGMVTQDFFPHSNGKDDGCVQMTSTSPCQNPSSYVTSKECKSSITAVPQFDLNEGRTSPSSTPSPPRVAYSTQEMWKRERAPESSKDARRLSWFQETKGNWEHAGSMNGATPSLAERASTSPRRDEKRSYITMGSAKESASEFTETERDFLSPLTKKAVFASHGFRSDDSSGGQRASKRPLTLFEGADINPGDDDCIGGGSVLTIGAGEGAAVSRMSNGGVKRRSYERSPSSSAWSDDRRSPWRSPRRCSPEATDQYRRSLGRGGSLDFSTWPENGGGSDARDQRRGSTWEQSGRFKEDVREGGLSGSMNRFEHRRSSLMDSTLESSNQRARDPRRSGLSRSEVVEGSVDAANRGVRVYKCSVCDRGFSSYQALGGHKSSHKREYTRAQQRTGLHLPLPLYVMSRPMGLEGAVMTTAAHHVSDWGLQNLGLQVQQPIYIQPQQPGMVLMEDPSGSQAASQLQQLSAYQKNALRFSYQ